MLTTSKLKKHVFVLQACKTEADVRRVLTGIERCGKLLRDRTAMVAEVGNGDYRVPTMILPNAGAGVVLEDLDSAKGELSLDAVRRMKPHFLERIMGLPRIWRAFLSLKISLKGMRNIELTLSRIDEVWFLGFGWQGQPKDVEQARACFRHLFGLAEMQIENKVSEDGYSFRHLVDGGLVYTNPNKPSPLVEDGKYLIGVSASIPGADTRTVLAKFKAVASNQNLRVRNGGWSFIFRGSDSCEGIPQNICERISEMHCLGKKVSCLFSWHLRSYKDFPRMAEMVPFHSEPVAQSLLECEFGSGQRVQLDIMCKSRNRFCLFISFDNSEESQEFERVFETKLKPVAD